MVHPNDQPESVDAVSFPPPGKTSRHVLDIDGIEVNYEATADWITLRKIHRPIGHVFYAAYVVTETTGQRPLTFVFNGGPGAAAAFLHMGALGPQRVVFGPEGSIPKLPVQVIDNVESWLAFTDLVFIDPLGTGFSRAIKSASSKSDKETNHDASRDPEEDTEFWEIERDVESLGDFICRYLSLQQRWTAPLFIAGESYGGFRVAKMTRKLQEEHGVGLCGALLISPAIEFDGLFGSDYNLTHWIELFPSLVASAHHHGLAKGLPDGLSVSEAFAHASQFAVQELPVLLTAGDLMPETQRVATLARIAQMTGISIEHISRTGGRLDASTFCRELLRHDQKFCGRYDASVTAVDPFPDRADYSGPDPTLFSIDRLFTAAVNHQLRSTLQLDTELDYRLLSMEVHKDWKHKTDDHVFRKLVGAMDELRYGMSLNEHMRVFVTHGYFDLITPSFSSQRLASHMNLTESQQSNLQVKSYAGGHMFYSWDESRVAFRDDAAAFYASAYGADIRLA